MLGGRRRRLGGLNGVFVGFVLLRREAEVPQLGIRIGRELVLPQHLTESSFTPTVAFPTHADRHQRAGSQGGLAPASALSSFGLSPETPSILVAADSGGQQEYRVAALSVRRQNPSIGAERSRG